MIIDAHTHMLVNKNTDGEDLIRSMELCGIDKTIVSCLDALTPDDAEVCAMNKKTYDLMKKYPDKVWGGCYVSPLLESCRDTIRRGIEDMDMKLIKVWLACACDDVQMNKVAEEAIRYNVPLLIHAFFMQSGNPPFESRANHVRNLALRYPELKILMAHLGGNPYHGMREVADLTNVYVDYAGTFYGYSDIDYAVQTVGCDRIVFGTDFPIASELFGIGKIEHANISQSDKNKIYSENILRLIDRNYHIGDEIKKAENDRAIDFGRFEKEHIDINAAFGPLPYFKTPYNTLDELIETRKKTKTSAVLASSLDALFFEDAYQADAEFVKTECDGFVKKVATINPTMPKALDDIREFAPQTHAVKISPYLHGYSLCDERVIAFADECAKQNVPLMINTRLFDERQQYCVKSSKTDMEDIENFLGKATSTTVVLLSLRENEIIKIAEKGYDNVFFDVSGLKGGTYIIEMLVDKIGHEKLMYGSCSPIYNEKSTLYLVSGADMDEKIKSDILSNTAKKVFGI